MIEIESVKENLTKDSSKLYGNKELIECVKHFNNFLESNDEGNQLVESIDLAIGISEWKTFKNDIITNYSGAGIPALV